MGRDDMEPIDFTELQQISIHSPRMGRDRIRLWMTVLS